MVNELNELNAQNFTVRFSQKKSEVNKVDIPEGEGSVQLRVQSQFFISCGNSKTIVLTKMSMTAKNG